MRTFRIYEKNPPSRLVRVSDSPRGVALFMWGKNLADYCIFVQLTGLDPDINRMEKQLVDSEARSIYG